MPTKKPPVNRFSRNRFADRGADAEKAVRAFLTHWAEKTVEHDFERLTDTKAAGRIIKAAAADFSFYSPRGFGLIEVKETEHEYRLARSKVTQVPRMRRRALAGGVCFVVVHHSTLGVWKTISVEELHTTGDKGSWNLSTKPGYPSAALAIQAHLPEVFGG